MKVETIFASNSQVVMNIRIMLFIVMMMVMPVSYAACYSELSV
ncbi:adhesin, partial [Escherichia coli]